MPDFDWNDARMLLAVARHGSTLTASRHLKVSQTTVVRRIAALEEALKLALVERRQTGYRLTEEAQALLPDFETLEAAALRISSVAEAGRRQVSGVLRVTTHEVIANLTLPKALKAFRQKYPDIAVEVLTSDRLLNLEKGEADIAIRSGPRPTEPGLVARLIDEGRWGVFASHDYIAEHGQPTCVEDLNTHSFVSGEGGWADEVETWLAHNAPGARVQFRNSSMFGVINQVRAGLGLGVLPYELLRRDPELVWCLTPPQPPSHTWLITHERLRNVTRVRAFLDFVVAFNNAAKARARVREAAEAS
ncbi:MAG: LysR family transcriptional regulator [Caulobacteraceae bacterium]|nr:LysR family transcriptional regulator [Caulobacteraceae bacterium]